MRFVLPAIGVLAALLSIGAAAPTAPMPQPAATPSQDAAARLHTRLAQLATENPEAYFSLAEEVTDADRSPEGQRLATRLFVLAYTLDLARGGSTTLAASACLALAELSPARAEREWLRTLAVQVDPRRETPGWVRRKPPATSEAIDYQVAAAVGMARSGDGIYARQLLRKPEVRARLEQLDRVARRTGVSGGADSIMREASTWPCPSCQNRRAERRAGSLTGEARLCSQCKGRPGTPLSKSELIAQLRFESWLLAGARRTWSSQVTLDMGAPLPDLDPASLPRLLMIDPTRPFFRAGKWVRTPDGDPPEPVPTTPGAGNGAGPPPAPTTSGG